MENNFSQIMMNNLISYVLLIAYYEIGKYFNESYCDFSNLKFTKKWMVIFAIRLTPLIGSLQFFKTGTVNFIFTNDYIASMITITFGILILLMDCKKKRVRND